MTKCPAKMLVSTSFFTQILRLSGLPLEYSQRLDGKVVQLLRKCNVFVDSLATMYSDHIHTDKALAAREYFNQVF